MSKISSLITSSLIAIARKFIGTGITSRFPVLFDAFFWVWPKVIGNRTKVFTIKVKDISFKIKAFLKDANTGIYLLTKGTYEPTTASLIADTLKPNHLFIDVGANIGYFSLLAHKSGAKVISFEPDLSVIPLLQENIALNKADSIKVEQIALGKENGQAFIQTDAVHHGHGQLADTGQPTKLIRLDSYLSAHKLNPNLIKMDIEGAERDALIGLGKVKDCHLIIEINQHTVREWGYSISDLLGSIRTAGFTPKMLIDETKAQTLPFSDKNLKKVFSHVHFCNLFCRS